MKDTKATPFFAKFLEGMEETEIERVKGGATMKYPSDSDEWIIWDEEKKDAVDGPPLITKKYPSDDDTFEL